MTHLHLIRVLNFSLKLDMESAYHSSLSACRAPRFGSGCSSSMYFSFCHVLEDIAHFERDFPMLNRIFLGLSNEMLRRLCYRLCKSFSKQLPAYEGIYDPNTQYNFILHIEAFGRREEEPSALPIPGSQRTFRSLLRKQDSTQTQGLAYCLSSFKASVSK